MFTQAEFLNKLLPLLQSKGRVFQKNKNVLARRAQAGELIATHTADGLETINTAGEGDFIVRNQTAAGEEYVVPAHKFAQRYELYRTTGGEWLEYVSKGRIVAIEITSELLQTLDLPLEFHFEALWKEDMVARAGDFLASPSDFSEIYRIARKEFFETYR